ncbi:MAG TPA: family 43 glycosylhydrolase [Solirubrobacteraceae bacterium]
MRRLRLGLAVLGLSAAWVPAAGAGILPPLPVPLPPLPVAPLPAPGSGGSTAGSPATPPPPRPSRSPPSSCADQSVPGVIPFALAVFPCDFPDPMVLQAGGAWYAYASATGWEPGGHAFPVLRSTDLRHWRFVGDGLTSPPRWSSGDLWGPSVLSWRGRYLLFYSARVHGGGLHCLAVATAPTPQGPFQTVRRLACRSGRERGYIDPAPLIAPRRRPYLFFSVDRPRHSISALRLSADGLRVIGPPRTILSVSPRWGALRARTVEGPWPLHRGAFYYLFYSAGSWSADYRMAYAVSRFPLGPYFDSAPVPILSGSAQLPAPGGGSVLTGPGGRNWLAFAAWSALPGYTRGSQRTMRIAPLHWTPQGMPEVLLSGSSPLARLSPVRGGVPYSVGLGAGRRAGLIPTRSCPAACS